MVSLEELHGLYKKHLHIEDTNRIDVVVAVALSYKLVGIPLWLILVGPSGDMKSVQLNSIRGDVTVLHNLTSKTLVNGYKDKKKFPDLAPKLDGKIVIVPDMSQILTLPPLEKMAVWAQLRDLYDGLAGKNSGSGSSAKYEGLKITLLAGATTVIDSQILIHQSLGTRELIYRTSGNLNKEILMDKCFENESQEEHVNNLLRKATSQFIEEQECKHIEVSKENLNAIKKAALFTTKMRATAEFDSYFNELRNFVTPEEPSRVAKQFKRLFICLKNLSPNDPNEKALEIIGHIAKSNAPPTRVKILELLNDKNIKMSTTKIAETLNVGKSTVKRECSVLEAVQLIQCVRKSDDSRFGYLLEEWHSLDHAGGDKA